MPNDPIMLLSFVNTKLRDEFSSFSDLCLSENAAEKEIEEKLNSINYYYNAETNQFV